MAIAPLSLAVVLLGALVGPVLAALSRRTPEPHARPGRRRIAALAVACPLLALWSLVALPGALGVLGALLGWQLLLLAILDAEHFWLPLKLTLTLIAGGLIAALPEGGAALLDRTIGAVAGFAALSVVAFAYRRLRGRDGLGGGDAWMLAGGGAWTGWVALPSILVLSAVAGLAWVMSLRLFGRRLAANQPLPFGVALAAGTWLVWLYGPLGL